MVIKVKEEVGGEVGGGVGGWMGGLVNRWVKGYYKLTKKGHSCLCYLVPKLIDRTNPENNFTKPLYVCDIDYITKGW